MLFGRAQEEIDYLSAQGIAVEIVPGISAAFGASAGIRKSLTQRGLSRNVVFATPAMGTGEPHNTWVQSVTSADTAVLYMASRQAARVSLTLLEAGVPPSRTAVLVENATLPNERCWATTVGQLAKTAEHLSDGPALIMIGEVFAESATSEASILEKAARGAMSQVISYAA